MSTLLRDVRPHPLGWRLPAHTTLLWMVRLATFTTPIAETMESRPPVRRRHQSRSSQAWYRAEVTRWTPTISETYTLAQHFLTKCGRLSSPQAQKNSSPVRVRPALPTVRQARRSSLTRGPRCRRLTGNGFSSPTRKTTKSGACRWPTAQQQLLPEAVVVTLPAMLTVLAPRYSWVLPVALYSTRLTMVTSLTQPTTSCAASTTQRRP